MKIVLFDYLYNTKEWSISDIQIQGQARLDSWLGPNKVRLDVAQLAEKQFKFTLWRKYGHWYQDPKPYSDCNVGINSASIAATLAPNPATDRCTVEATGLQRVQLLDLMGRTLIDQPCADRCTLNLEYIPAGIYLVRSHTAEGIGTNKLIVQK